MSKFDDMLKEYTTEKKVVINEELSASDKNKIVDVADNFVEVVTAKIIQDGRAKGSSNSGYEVKVKDNVLTIKDNTKTGDVNVVIKTIIDVDGNAIEISEISDVTAVMTAIHAKLRSLGNVQPEAPAAPAAPATVPEAAAPAAVKEPEVKAEPEVKK